MQGSERVIADLQSAANLECQLQLQYHLDDRLLKRMELDGWASHADKWGESSEWILKDISDTLIGFRVDPAYAGGKPVANANPQFLLATWLKLESEIHTAYAEFYVNALDEGDVDTSHDFKDYSHMHKKRLLWIERKQEQIINFGLDEYLLEALS